MLGARATSSTERRTGAGRGLFRDRGALDPRARACNTGLAHVPPRARRHGGRRHGSGGRVGGGPGAQPDLVLISSRRAQGIGRALAAIDALEKKQAGQALAPDLRGLGSSAKGDPPARA